MKIYAENRRARFDYTISDKFEAGIELKGHEVKAIKTGHVSLLGSFVIVKNNQAQLLNADIPPYQPANTPKGYDSKRTRRLLLSAKEIKTLLGKTQEKGLTLVPIKMYNKGDLIKLEIGLGKSKKKADKRLVIKKRDVEREIAQKLKN
ncbi:MAG: SsrA-binding protein SmpB [Patescibacteria group bacterium]